LDTPTEAAQVKKKKKKGKGESDGLKIKYRGGGGVRERAHSVALDSSGKSCLPGRG